MKFYDPPTALLPKGDQFSVDLAGAKVLLAIDESKNIFNIGTIFSEISRGDYWQGSENINIQDQIEKINILAEDAEALYEPKELANRIKKALDTIVKSGLLFLGVASFEGNAFETTMFDEISLNNEDQDRLVNLYKHSRQAGYPDLKKELGAGNSYVEINFFGTASTYFTFPNKKNIKQIASILYAYQGYASGIVAVAQGAANFILLTDNILKDIDSSTIHIDRKNLEQMFRLINLGVLEAPISWFKIDLGLIGLETLDNWDEIKQYESIIKAKSLYMEYIEKLIVEYKPPEMEKIIDNDIGNQIQDISTMTNEEIQEDLDRIIGAINILNEYDQEDRSVSLLTDPPKILFAYGDKREVAVGGAMTLLSVDVGANICCIADIRENVSWVEYFHDEEEIDENTYFDIKEDTQFLEMEDPTALRDIYIKALQSIMIGSEVLLGVLELESNAFNFSLFQELDIPSEELDKLQTYYKNKIKQGKFPKLSDRRIKVKWYGEGNDKFNFEGIFRSILDIANEIQINPAYHNTFATGIVATTQESTSFYILSSDIKSDNVGLDYTTLHALYKRLDETDMAPLCWFKINLGIETLSLHPFWKGAFQYDNLRIVLSNYQKYIENLIRIQKKEDIFRIY